MGNKSMSSITSRYKDDGKYETILCKLRLDYLNPNTKELYKTIDYTIGIKVPLFGQGDYTLGIDPILEYGCNCSIITTIEMDTAMYKGVDCKNEVLPGSSLTYGDTLCLKMTSSDPLVANSRFITTALELTYRNNQGRLTKVDVKSISTVGCGNPCKSAIAYAYVDLLFVGEIVYTQVVVFDKVRRLMGSNDYIDDDFNVTSSTGAKSGYAAINVEESNGLALKEFTGLLTAALITVIFLIL